MNVEALERKLAEQQEALERLREDLEAIQRMGTSRFQGRRAASTKPTDKQVYMWDESAGKWEPATGAQIKLSRATSNLTLSQSAQSIVGDGDGSKVRLVLPTIGDWEVKAFCDLDMAVAGSGILFGELFVNDSGSAESGRVQYIPDAAASERATVGQVWKVTVTAADTPVELKARKQNAGGTAYAYVTSTVLVASIGIGGGSVAAASDHGGLTGLGDSSDHAYATLKDGTRAFTGEQSMGTNKLTNVVDPTANQDAATKKYADDAVKRETHITLAHSISGIAFSS